MLEERIADLAAAVKENTAMLAKVISSPSFTWLGINSATSQVLASSCRSQPSKMLSTRRRSFLWLIQ